MENQPSDRMWDEVRVALATSAVQRENREDALAVAATEIALMRVVDRGRRADVVIAHVAGDRVSGRVVEWTEDVIVLETTTGGCAIRVGAIDALEGLPRALRSERHDPPSFRSILDPWSWRDVEVDTNSGRYRGTLVVAADHVEVGPLVVPWAAVRTVRWWA